jgi:hypothetical protein
MVEIGSTILLVMMLLIHKIGVQIKFIRKVKVENWVNSIIRLMKNTHVTNLKHPSHNVELIICHQIFHTKVWNLDQKGNIQW